MYIKCLYNYVFESEYENIIFIKTRNSPSLTPVDQGEVGISATVIFETLTGEIATTHLELHNEGSTAIYYSWQQLLLPCHFPNLRSQRKTLCFHFNSSSGNKHTQSDTCWHHSYVRRCLSLFQPVTLRLSTGTQPASLFFILLPPPIQDVILPGDTKRMVFIFKSETPGIKTELWQLNTHPVLLQAASIQVTLRGVSLYQDKTADQRLFLEVLYN